MIPQSRIMLHTEFQVILKKVWGRVINPLWCLKAPSPATKKWIFEFYTKFGFRNHLQTFWPQWLVKSELSLGPLEGEMYISSGKMYMGGFWRP